MKSLGACSHDSLKKRSKLRGVRSGFPSRKLILLSLDEVIEEKMIFTEQLISLPMQLGSLAFVFFLQLELVREKSTFWISFLDPIW